MGSLERAVKGFVPNNEQRILMGKWYQDALNIAQSINMRDLHDDEKETVGIAGLIKASRSYDQTKGKFPTYLYLCIKCELINTLKRVLRKKTVNIKNIKTGKVKKSIEINPLRILPSKQISLSHRIGWPFSELIDILKENNIVSNYDEFEHVVNEVKKYLNKKDRHIFSMLVNPNKIRRNFKRYGLKQEPIAINKALIGKICGFTRERARQRIERIKNIVKKTVRRELLTK